MKPLQEELETQKVFNAIRKVSMLEVPALHEVTFDDDVKALGRCYKNGGISISFTNITDRTAKNVQFVETVCHEVVHYNHYTYGHSKLFYEILTELTEKVRKELCL